MHGPIGPVDLQRALERAEFFLLYQPCIALGSGALLGVEALIRWQCPQRGLVPPSAFVPVAESTGLIQPITRWVVGMALRQQAAWRAAGRQIACAINLSAVSFASVTFPDQLADWCRAAGESPDGLTLEITESAAMADPVVALEVLTRLRLKGFRLALDDFGTGYSSLQRLQRMPFSDLKIDRSFVSEALRSRSARVIVQAITDLAHTLGLRVVAEGVEDEATLRHLQAVGADAAQGYFIARPLAEEDLAGWADAWAATPHLAADAGTRPAKARARL